MENNLTGFIKEVLENIIENNEDDYNLNKKQLKNIVEVVNADDSYFEVIWTETEIALVDALNRKIK